MDGGVSNNDFVLQTIANLTGKPVIRPTCREMTALGCAFMAGVNCGWFKMLIISFIQLFLLILCQLFIKGFWNSKEMLEKFYKIDKVFHPNQEIEETIQQRFAEWERAVIRYLAWNKKS